jgi:glycosyltransferase involved in cell wall biosynthesis
MSCPKWKNGNACHHCKGNEKLKKGTFKASWYLNCKRANLQDKNYYFVSPSKWLIDCCKESYLKDEDIRLIPNGIDTEVFIPHEKEQMRIKYGIPNDKYVLLFSANTINSPYKGYKYLYEALDIIDKKEDYYLVILGNIDGKDIDAAYDVLKMGYISNENIMSELYSAADIYIMPSLADNAPLSSMEAMASGTPVLAFATGGIPEIVTDEVGWLSPAGDSKKLAETICKIFGNLNDWKKKAELCRTHIVRKYSNHTMLEKYNVLYFEIMTK